MSGRHNTIAEIFNYPCSGKNIKEICSYDNKTCRGQCYKNRQRDIFDDDNDEPCSCPDSANGNKINYQNGSVAPVCNGKPKVTVPRHDNMDVINDVYGYKMPTADERLADKMRHQGTKAQKALIGATRTTRAEFQCHFTEEMEETAKRNGWWDDYEYEVDEENYWNNVNSYESDYMY